MSASSKSVHNDGADLPIVIWLERAQHPMLFSRKMRQRVTIAAKDVVIKEGLPGLPLSRRPFGDGDHAEQQSSIGRIRTGRKGARAGAARILPTSAAKPLQSSFVVPLSTITMA